jgi:hypothetical protein
MHEKIVGLLTCPKRTSACSLNGFFGMVFLTVLNHAIEDFTDLLCHGSFENL